MSTAKKHRATRFNIEVNGDCAASSSHSYQQASSAHSPWSTVSLDKSNGEKLVLMNIEALQQAVHMANEHGAQCGGLLSIDSRNTSQWKTVGFWIKMPMQCSKGVMCAVYPNKTAYISSSSYLPYGRALVNERMIHAYYSSGLIISQLTRLMAAAQILSTEKFIQHSSTQRDTYMEAANKVGLLFCYQVKIVWFSDSGMFDEALLYILYYSII